MGAPVGPARLVPLVGLSAAKDLILTGRTIGMDEARALGLLHRTAPAADAEAAAIALARDVAAHDPAAVRTLKAMLRDYAGAAVNVEDENARLVEWQRTGAGLPVGARPE
jgi:enoyl-CoA hydratase/carnithine racemase